MSSGASGSRSGKGGKGGPRKGKDKDAEKSSHPPQSVTPPKDSGWEDLMPDEYSTYHEISRTTTKYHKTCTKLHINLTKHHV